MPRISDVKAPADERKLMGNCHSATLIEAGVIGSTVSAEDWHKLCIGVNVDGRGKVHRCECDCHEGETRCVDCGELHANLDELAELPADRVRCIDREECAERFKKRLAANPAWQRHLEHEAAVAAIKAAEAPEKQAQAQERRAKSITPGRCHHCGEPTKGGNFVMGHDMKLKGILLRAAREGDERALAEFMERGWFKDAKTHKVPQQVADAAEALGTNSSSWLAQRVEDRLRMLDTGADPEEAVRTQ